MSEALSLAESSQLLTPDEVATILRVSPAQLVAWRRKGQGPKFIQLNQTTIRYRMHELVKYQDSCLSGGVG